MFRDGRPEVLPELLRDSPFAPFLSLDSAVARLLLRWRCELLVVLEVPRACAALRTLERRLDGLRLTGLRMRATGTPVLAARFACACCADTAELERLARAVLDGAAAATIALVIASPGAKLAAPPGLGAEFFS